ncbi:hypothetical protein AAG570_002049 [Ranatra chinensis]|uniref:Uncharacterized protein n=1 Tax=Ranatra chinensis TaxID=642074 RepID=A0ABD0YC71_9HEMI
MDVSSSLPDDNAEKTVSFVKDIQLMMFGLGDCSEPLVESAELVERVVLRQMVIALAQAGAVTALRGQTVIAPDDLLFLMRNSMEGLKRLLEYLGIKDERQLLNKTVKSVSEPDEALEGGGGGGDMEEYPTITWEKSRRMYCLQFLNSIGIEEADIQGADDTIKLERQHRANQTSIQLSQSAYESFHTARRASFGASQLTAKRFERWLKSRGEVTCELRPPVIEILVYLAKETVATLIDRVLTLREENVSEIQMTEPPPISVTEIREVVRRSWMPNTMPLSIFSRDIPNFARRRECHPNPPNSAREIMEEEFDEGELVDETGMPEINNDEDYNADDEDAIDDIPSSMVTGSSGEEDVSDFYGDMEPVDEGAVVFSKHVGSVFSCCLEPGEGNMAVTGGEDNTVYFWDSTNGAVIHSDSEFEDSVIAVEFSHDGRYVAALDMSGRAKVWRLVSDDTRRSVVEAWTDTLGDEGTWLKWHHASALVLCGSIAGHVAMWRIPSGMCKILPGYGTATEAGMFMPDGKRAVIGYKDGCVKVFDLNTGMMTANLQSGALSSILCIDAHQDNNLIAAGTLNSQVALFATQTSRLISLYACVEDVGGGREGEEENSISVESVLFSKDASMPVIAIGTTSSIHIWDYSKQVLRGQLKMTEGVCTMLWPPSTGPHLFAGTMMGPVRVVDTRQLTVEGQFRGNSSNVLAMAVSNHCSKEQLSNIWFLGKSKPSSERLLGAASICSPQRSRVEKGGVQVLGSPRAVNTRLKILRLPVRLRLVWSHRALPYHGNFRHSIE